MLCMVVLVFDYLLLVFATWDKSKFGQCLLIVIPGTVFFDLPLAFMFHFVCLLIGFRTSMFKKDMSGQSSHPAKAVNCLNPSSLQASREEPGAAGRQETSPV